MHFEDKIYRPTGDFHLRVFRCGKLIDEEITCNIVVDLSKQQLARLSGGDVANRSISKIGFGESNAAAAAGNTSLTSAFVKAVDGVTYPTTNSVQFAFSLSTAEGNGKSLWEFGLLTGGDVLFARRVRGGALFKDSDLSLSGTWRINY